MDEDDMTTEEGQAADELVGAMLQAAEQELAPHVDSLGRSFAELVTVILENEGAMADGRRLIAARMLGIAPAEINGMPSEAIAYATLAAMAIKDHGVSKIDVRCVTSVEGTDPSNLNSQPFRGG